MQPKNELVMTQAYLTPQPFKKGFIYFIKDLEKLGQV